MKNNHFWNCMLTLPLGVVQPARVAVRDVGDKHSADASGMCILTAGQSCECCRVQPRSEPQQC